MSDLQFHGYSGQWRKKIKGKVHYFGKDHEEAERRYLQLRGEQRVAVSFRDIVNIFLQAKEAQVARGTLAQRSFDEYLACATRLKKSGFQIDRPLLSFTPLEWQDLQDRLAKSFDGKNKTRSVVSQNEDIRRIRIMAKFAFDQGLIQRPVRFGQFKLLAKKVLRRHKVKREFERGEILTVLEKATPILKAMILLAINCGFGNDDVSALRPEHCKVHRSNSLDLLPLEDAIDTTNAMIYLPRNKTGLERKCYLWPETVGAIREAGGLPLRLKADDTARAISKRFCKLVARAGIQGEGKNFYALRHTFQTVADSAPFAKEHAVKLIMGHVDNSMSGNYRQRISTEQLKYIAEYVRAWLFGLEAPNAF